MPRLPQEAVQRYHRDGYFSPIRVLSPAQAAGYRQRLHAIEESGRLPAGGLRSKSHLLLTWVDEIVRHPDVLDAVESVIGPDILAWGTSFFIKEPRNKSFVSSALPTPPLSSVTPAAARCTTSRATCPTISSRSCAITTGCWP